MRKPVAKPIIANAVSGLRSHSADCVCLAWTAGLLAAFLGFAFAGMVLAGGFALFSAAIFLPPFQRFRGNWLPFLLLAAGMLCGTVAWLHYDSSVRQPLCAMDGEQLTLTGTVVSRSRNTGDRNVYTLRTELAGHRADTDWYAEAEVPLLDIGDTVTLNAELTRIPSEYASNTAAFQAGLGKYLRIYRAELCDVQKDTGFSLLRALRDEREQIAAEITRRLPEDCAALMNGMLFGDKTALNDDTREALYAAGIGHITAVSGLHLVFFFALVMRILRMLHLPRRLRFLIGMGAVGLFILIADDSASVRRAAIMLLLTQSAPLFGRHGDTFRGLCIAMLLCTVFTPYVIGAAGFWLSVSGVLGIGVIAPYMTEHLRCRTIIKNLLGLCCVSTAVFPASVLMLGQSSLISPLSNLVILPIGIAALYIGLIVLLTGGLAAFLLPLAVPLCKILLKAAELAAEIPFSHITLSSVPVQIGVGAVTVLLLLLALRVPKKRVVSAFLVCCLILLAQSLYAAQTEKRLLQIAMLGRNKDSAAVIVCGGEAYIVDLTGSERNLRYVHKFLQDRNITEVQILYAPPKNLTRYQEQLGGITLQNTYPLNAESRISANRGALSVRAESGTLSLSWNGISAVILPAAEETAANAEIVVRYGGEPQTADAFAKRLCPAVTAESCTPPEYGGQNRLIRLTADGRGEIVKL